MPEDKSMQPIYPRMLREIRARLDAIEAEEAVRILFAVESGSRAWGFPSPDSDYDVRFVYVRPRDWYLSIDQRRDVIEIPIEGLFYINGWDLQAMDALIQEVFALARPTAYPRNVEAGDLIEAANEIFRTIVEQRT